MSVDDTLMCSFQILKPAERKQQRLMYNSNMMSNNNNSLTVSGNNRVSTPSTNGRNKMQNQSNCKF